LSHTYKPGFSTDPDLTGERIRLQRALNDAQPEFTLQVRHAAPAKTWAGMLCYFDGSDFNPGSGEGVYRRDKANLVWVFLG